MTSPFPGMDPYLESHWLDVHSSMAVEARNALNASLPDDLVASVEERTEIASGLDDDVDYVFRPDVKTFEPPTGTERVESRAGGAVVAAPFRLVVDLELGTERSVRIVAAGTERLVTVIEFISPANKRGLGLNEFRRKRGELLSSGVNVVEIDLVRAGDWQALMAPHECPREARTAYRATIRVPGDNRSAYLFPAPIREPLPAVQVPLREGDPVVMLELQTLLDRTYANGRYARRVDYHADPVPMLDTVDATWADSLLRAAGRR